MNLWRNLKLLFSFVLMLSLAAGCASRKEIVQFKEDTAFLRAKMDTLSHENKVLREDINQLNLQMSQFIRESNEQRAYLMTEIGTLRDLNQYIDSKLDDNILQVTRYVNKSIPASGGQRSTPAPAGSSQEPPDTTRSSQLLFDAQTLYNNAYLDLTRGNYKLALEGFNDFLKSFPENDLAVNAQYWIGECFYAQGLYHLAFDEFQAVTTRYPNGSKVPAALLKMGYSAHRMGDKSTARNYLQMVIDRYPKSEEARLAKQQLETLSKN